MEEVHRAICEDIDQEYFKADKRHQASGSRSTSSHTKINTKETPTPLVEN